MLFNGRGGGYIGRMKRILKALAICAVLGAALAGTGGELRAQGALAAFEKGELAIESGGKVHPFKVEVATNSRQHAQGLMFRRSMAPDAGMLFVYPREERIAMWMKNTLIPLDMIFIARGGRIAKIAERTVPMSEETIPSGDPVVAVLELNAGTASRLGLKPGDRVKSPALGGR